MFALEASVYPRLNCGIKCKGVRPHPGPLPQEKENCSSVFRIPGRFSARAVHVPNHREAGKSQANFKCPAACFGGSLSPGERAGVRAVVHTTFPMQPSLVLSVPP